MKLRFLKGNWRYGKFKLQYRDNTVLDWTDVPVEEESEKEYCCDAYKINYRGWVVSEFWIYCPWCGKKIDYEEEVNKYFSDSPVVLSKVLIDKDLFIGFLKQAHENGKKEQIIDGNTSDGYHTFNELYNHRMILFSVICNSNKEISWKSKLHSDGTMFDDYFIVGINTPEGQYTYHYHLRYWDLFDVQVFGKAPKWDGHKPEDVSRLMSLEKIK